MASCYSYESERHKKTNDEYNITRTTSQLMRTSKKKNERDREVAKVVNSEDETLRKLSKI